MGKEKIQKKNGIFDLNFKGMKIEERLRKAFNVIIIIASIGSVVGILSLMIVVANFESAMKNYALPQGDIALFMNEYAESRSNMRGIIGYEDQDLIDQLVVKHEARKETTYERLAAIKDTIVTPEGEAAYAKIESALEAYFEKEAEVISIGATTDQEKCRQAQEMAIKEITPLYEALDNATLELMNINIQKEHEMEFVCEALEVGAMILMVVLIVCASIGAKRIAHNISKGIAKPLAELEERFESFAEGDIRTPFPTSSAKDEIAGLMNASHDMAERLQMIIFDVQRLCQEMGNGNFNVESDCALA